MGRSRENGKMQFRREEVKKIGRSRIGGKKQRKWEDAIEKRRS